MSLLVYVLVADVTNEIPVTVEPARLGVTTASAMAFFADGTARFCAPI
jgi:hypothetical protein